MTSSFALRMPASSSLSRTLATTSALKVVTAGLGGARQLPAKGFGAFPPASFIFDAAPTVARLVAAHARRKDDFTHPVGSFLVQGETHGQPKSPTRRLSRGPLISSWASSSWTADARAPAVARWRRRPRQ